MKPKPATLTSGRSIFHLHPDGEYRKEAPAPYKVADTFADGSPTMFREIKPRMNKTETQLYGMLLTRGYTSVEFEAVSLRLADGARYTPDFVCITLRHLPHSTPCTVTIYYEAKGGFIREAALVRLKVAARLYPHAIFILAQKKKGQWKETVISNSAQS